MTNAAMLASYALDFSSLLLESLNDFSTLFSIDEKINSSAVRCPIVVRNRADIK